MRWTKISNEWISECETYRIRPATSNPNWYSLFVNEGGGEFFHSSYRSEYQAKQTAQEIENTK